ncbi:hypothetical protein ONS95_011440 [Cadophora gregata]|uniref:uncharacterized protein n=1 Tax=Cadophora gregata TaxID=51156 RepID=UPI0026DCDA14|nr:uncharacterized protein ONS95_011440 [Cadophora gregata]KAK0120026.1 hypothetical protein ONS95_011440 [Cadophora gregata]KAK0121058.1 hypothetical protein ONS96_011242 [Cadophora gregata f. sp. sojae]
MPPRKKATRRSSGTFDQMQGSSAPALTQTTLPSPRKRISAPPDRVYKSSTPLTQSKLPVPRKHIRSYGKKTSVRIPKPTKQETLTQMDYLRMRNPPPLGDDEQDPVEVEEPDGDYEKQAKKRKNKRRKTAGDEPDSTPSFHTQRLTQMEWSFTSAPDEEEDPSIFDVPSSSQTTLPTLSSRKKTGESSKASAADPQTSPINEMPPPQTPRRILATEIPSSQSPATPVSVRSGKFLGRSPLKETPINTPIPFNTGRRPELSPEKLPKLEVKDTYDSVDTTQFSRVPSSPAKRPSPAKSVRFVFPEDDEIEEPLSPMVKRRSTPARKSAMKRTVILDSDAESDDEVDEVDEEEDEEIAPGREFDNEVVGSQELGNDEDYRVSESELSCSVELGLSRDTLDQEHHTAESPELGNDELVEDYAAQKSQEEEAEPETCYGNIGLETQMEADRILGSSELRHMTKEPEVPQDEDDDDEDENEEEQEDSEIQHETAVEKTQIMESQRLSTQHAHSMGPRTAESDVFVSMHPAHVTNIVSGAKNHEFRNWAFALHVRRIWIYEMKPTSMLKYMAEIGPAKKPGELADDMGLGNVDFNKKASTWRAYEILQVYQLADPKHLPELKENGWLKAPPSKTARVAPAVIDELMANLLPPLFLDRYKPEPAAPASSSTDTQEVDEQLVCTMKQFTQPGDLSKASPDQVDEEVMSDEEGDEDIEERIPSSPSLQATPRPAPRSIRLPPPSQATTVDLSQTQTPMRHSQGEIIWESPARPVNSTPVSLPIPRHNSYLETQGHESHPTFSMSSSQILSKTQLLSDSLLQDTVPGPPAFIQDSDDEDD